MYRSLVLLTLFVALSVVATTILGDRDRPTVATSRHRDEAAELVARGRIEPLGGVVVVSGPPESLSTVAIVDKLLVKEGSKVTAGQVLAIINGYDLSRTDYKVALANLNVERLRRAQVQAGVGKRADIAAQTNLLAGRRALLVKTEKDWQRAKKLVEGHAASIQLLDAQRAAFDQITQEVEQAQNTIKALTEVRPVDDALAAGLVAAAEANVEKARASMERLQVRARQSGTVLSIQTRSGESIGADGILRLGDLDHLIVIAEIDETQVQRVTLGMKVSIGGPVCAGLIPATITRIGQETYRQKRPSSDILVGRDARVVEVEATPEKPLPGVVGAEVTVRSAEPAPSQ